MSDDLTRIKMFDVSEPDYFFQRFANGKNTRPDLPVLTFEESAKDFLRRDEGLRILLINLPIREWSYPNILPLGHAYVASVAIMDGHEVGVLDLNALREGPMEISHEEEMSDWIAAELKKFLEKSQMDWDVIGLGGIVTQFSRIQKTVKILRGLSPKSHICLGGGVASCMPEFMIERLVVDSCVQEEGEVTFSELLYRLENKISLSGCQGVCYREENGEIVNNGLRPSVESYEQGLDTLPWPARWLWPEDEIYKRNPVGHLNWETKWIGGKGNTDTPFSGVMLASRGCPYASKACDYCYASYLGKRYRLRSPADVVSEMVAITKRYDLEYIHFLDDLLITDHRWALEFFAELKRRREKDGFFVMWGGTCRANIIANDINRAASEGRKNILELGFEVGMRQAAYGIESGSPKILKNIDKSGQTREKIILTIKETQRVLGYADCSFMVGSPGETAKTVGETVSLCEEVGLRPEVIFFTTAYPATSFWDLAQEKGLIKLAVTGERGYADEDTVERYLVLLGEQGDKIRTNFSDIPDEELLSLASNAVRSLGATSMKREPHSGEKMRNEVAGALMADL